MAQLYVFCTAAMLLTTAMASPVVSPDLTSVAETAARTITGETEMKADIEDYPWQGYLLTKHFKGGVMGACGAVLLSEEWALTTAHCMHGVRSATVLSGGNSWVAMILGREGTQLPVTSVYEHPNYWPSIDLLTNNLALLQLERGNNSGSITPIRLPFPSQVNIKLEGKKVKVTGWGASSGDSDGLSATLQSTELKVMKGVDCAAAYGLPVVRPAIMCAEDDDKGAAGICKGDSGVAVSYTKGKDVYLVGVAQFRDGSCAAGAPTGFVNVQAYLDWITQVTGIEE